MEKIKEGKIGLAGSTAAAVGVSIGGGLWVGPVVASSIAGPQIIAVALLVAVPLFLSLPAYFTLVKVWPVSGAHYHYPARFLIPENKKLSQLVGWISVWTMASLGGIITLQYMLVAGAEFIHIIIPSIPILSLMILFMTFSFIITALGIRVIGWAELILCIILLTALAVVLLPGVGHIQTENLSSFSLSVDNAFAAFALLYAVASASFYVVDLGGAVKDAEITVNKSIVISVLTNMTAAWLIGLISVGVIPHTDLTGETLLFVSQQYLSSEYMIFVGIGALLAGITSVITLNAVYSRYIFATAEEGIMPEIFSRKNRFGEPMIFLGILYISALIGIFADMPIDMLASAVALSLLITFTLVLVVGFRLPTQFPEIFERESLKNSRILQPTIVRWSSGITVVINIIAITYLSIETPQAFQVLLALVSLGIFIYIISHNLGRVTDDTKIEVNND